MGRTIPDGSCGQKATSASAGVWTIAFGQSLEQLYRHQHVFEVIDRPPRVLLSRTEFRLDGANLQLETEFTFEPHDAAR